MADPTRIQGPSGSPEPSPKKDRTIGADDFKKYMVEEVKETDERSRKRKRKGEQQEEDTEDAKSVIGAPPPTQPTPLDTVAGPAHKQKVAPSAIPPSQTPVVPINKTPVPSFNVEDIEEYAWEEDSSGTPPSPTPTPPTPPVPQFRAGEATPPSQSATPPSSQDEEEQPTPPTYTPQEDYEAASEQAPPTPPPQYKTEDYEAPQWKEIPVTPEQATYQSQQQPAGPLIEGTKPAAKKKAKEPLGAQPLKPAAMPKATAKKAAMPEVVLPMTKEAKAAAAKGKKTAPLPPGEVVKKGKQAPADFKKLMEEPKAAAAEKEPAKEPSKAAKAPKGKQPSEAGPQPYLEAKAGKMPPQAAQPPSPDEAQFLPSPTPGMPPVEFPSTKKAPADKMSQKKVEESEEVEEGAPMAPFAQQPQAGQSDTGGERGRRRPGDVEAIAALAAATPSIAPPIAGGETAPLVSTSPFAELHPEILALFERMVGVMTVMKTTGISETTMTLNEQTFARSVLLGASITIRTYESAPNEMNIEFTGSSQALAMMQQNLPSLMAAFQAGNYNFVVKRFDFRVGNTERPIFRRKDELRDRSSDQQERDRDEGES